MIDVGASYGLLRTDNGDDSPLQGQFMFTCRIDTHVELKKNKKMGSRRQGSAALKKKM